MLTACVVRNKWIAQAQTRGILTFSIIWKRFWVLVDHCKLWWASLKRQLEPHLRFCVNRRVLIKATASSASSHLLDHCTLLHPSPLPIQSTKSPVSLENETWIPVLRLTSYSGFSLDNLSPWPNFRQGSSDISFQLGIIFRPCPWPVKSVSVKNPAKTSITTRPPTPVSDYSW